uniref:Uncharacterized protein n=1 Tax=Tanacetum cinerariifolium TaxID=118510 RepID=A0A699KD87_TANCI|nr:hypothetical protein [Tanacetum cinerariifolium]
MVVVKVAVVLEVWWWSDCGGGRLGLRMVVMVVAAGWSGVEVVKWRRLSGGGGDFGGSGKCDPGGGSGGVGTARGGE